MGAVYIHQTPAMRKKIKKWLCRYGPAEIISLPATLIPAQMCSMTDVLYESRNAVAAAVADTWGGNIGYFGTILLHDVRLTRKKYEAEGRYYGLRAIGKNLRVLFLEFGVAEALDTLLVRPALMYYLPRLMSNFPSVSSPQSCRRPYVLRSSHPLL